MFQIHGHSIGHSSHSLPIKAILRSPQSYLSKEELSLLMVSQFSSQSRELKNCFKRKAQIRRQPLDRKSSFKKIPSTESLDCIIQNTSQVLSLVEPQSIHEVLWLESRGGFSSCYLAQQGSD